MATPLFDLDDDEDGSDDSGGYSFAQAAGTVAAAASIGEFFGRIAASDGFNPDQPRDERGRWTGGGSSGGISGTAHVVLTGNELGEHVGTKELRKAAMAHAEKHLISKHGETPRPITNVNSGHSIKVTRQGMKHSLAGANDPEIRLSVGLAQMLEKADYVGPVPPTDRHKARGVLVMHQYLAKATLNGEKLNVGLVTHEKGDGHEHYNHAIVATAEPVKSGGG